MAILSLFEKLDQIESRYQELTAHAARCEALPPFQEIVQPLAPPSGD